MRNHKRFLLHVVAAFVGAVMAGGAVLAFDDITADRTKERQRVGTDPEPAKASPLEEVPTSTGPGTLLAWIPGGMPRDAVDAVAGVRGVEAASLISTRLEWLNESSSPKGEVVDRPRAGFRIPMEVALIEPSSFARFVAPSERQAVLSLGPREVLLAKSSAELRRAERGATLKLDRGTVEAVGELSDVSSGGYEALRVRPKNLVPTRSFLLAKVRGSATVARVERVLRDLVGSRTAIRVRTKGETPFLRYGDAVPPQLLLKQAFGEFAARAGTRVGSIEIDPAWTRRNIGTFNVPILGKVTCHRAVIPQLRAALSDLVARGAGSVVDPTSYAGCFVGRHISWDPGHFLSHHSWGVALDLNSSDNAFGTQGTQDSRLIEAMEENGLGWGGRWLIPDPMHFEWSAFRE